MTIFEDKYIPKDTRLAGLCFICQQLEIETNLTQFLAVSHKNLRQNQQHDIWQVYGHKYWPGEGLFAHLVFALKYENLNLLALKKILQHIGPSLLEQAIAATPTSIYSRKIWFLYEWLLQHQLNLKDLKGVTYVALLDDDKYFTIAGENSPRHKVINNLIGVKNFIAVIRKSDKLQQLLDDDLKAKTENIVAGFDRRLISRAASFLLLADTKATYEIEGERAAQNRIERWAKVILEAGKNELSLSEIERLHRILLKDDRFVSIGLRHSEVFLGERDQENHPLPEFIGAKKDDLPQLIEEWLKLNQKLKQSQLHPIIQTTIIAFAFVYIHPLQDGNGRLHRYLLHHLLSRLDFTPRAIVFPVSSVIFDRIEEYRDTLTSVSAPIYDAIEWRGDDKLNVEVLNETIDLYRYIDFTDNAEFLYDVVKETIETNLPQELMHLRMYDQAKNELNDYLEMPEDMLSLLINCVRDNDFKLSGRKKERFFSALTDLEVKTIEAIIQEAYSP